MLNQEDRFLSDYLWRNGKLDWLLWDQQKPIYQGIRGIDPSITLIVVLCARQFGKSYLGVLMAVEDCLQFKDVCILIVGPTLKQTTEIVAPRLRKIAETAPAGLIKRSKSESKWYIGTSELVIGGFDVNSTAQRGKTVQNIYIEEVVDSNPDQYTESMRSDLGPALTHSKNGRMIFNTTPPKIPDHPFITETMVEAQLCNSLYTYTIDDNKELSKQQYDACVRRSGGKDSIDFRREYLCEIVRDPSLVVVPDYDEKLDVYKTPKVELHLNHQITVDWGGARDKTVVLFHYYSFTENIDYVYFELSYPNNTHSDIVMIDILKHKDIFTSIYSPNEWAFVGDMPGQLSVDISIDYSDLNLVAPHKTDWQANVNNMSKSFSQRRVKVYKDCIFLRLTLRSGTYNKTKTDFERTKTLGHCDALAALMYGLRSRNKTSPFGINRGFGDIMDSIPTQDGFFRLPKENNNDKILQSLQPVNFVKKFGTKRF